jgi:hypothetical protein
MLAIPNVFSIGVKQQLTFAGGDGAASFRALINEPIRQNCGRGIVEIQSSISAKIPDIALFLRME